MKPALNKIFKIINLEKERGYDNRAVMGGIHKLRDKWEADARTDNLPEELVNEISSFLIKYSGADLAQRPIHFEQIMLKVFPGTITKKPDIKIENPPIPPEPSKTKASEEMPKSIVSEISPEHNAPEIRDEIPTEKEIKTRLDELDSPVSVIQGVGEKHSKTLNKLGIETLEDLLYYYPRRYDDYSKLIPIKKLTYDQEVTIIGTVESVGTRPFKNRKSQISEILLSDGTGSIRLTWFNQPWVAKRFRKGTQIVVSGKIDQYLGRLVMNNPEWESIDQKQLSTNRIVPVYPLTANLTQRWLRRVINQVVEFWADKISDPLPRWVKEKADLIDLQKAIQQVHFPDSSSGLEKARHRLAFDEIFHIQLGVLNEKRKWSQRTAVEFAVEDDWMNNQIESLPYQLTEAQQKSLADIRKDLRSGSPMNRLLQGDVGSGKTVVAVMGAGIVLNNGGQVCILAPTSILAEQHYLNIKNLLVNQFSDLGIENGQIALLLGATQTREKEEIKDRLLSGEIKVIIGTHALLEDPIKFQNLQMAVIDEQHRFGVRQRAVIRSKGDNPHLLVMTATPIPRSLSLTIYGDLDISVMDQLPPGRQEITTVVFSPVERERVYSFITKQVKEGRQAFIIYPLVEENERSESRGAVEEYQRLQEEIFPKIKLGLIHGRLKPTEKEEVMRNFRDGVFNVLVSTTVVEVGVDIPNATVMLIEGANRYGLAQLHQLRGRVGRGSDKSWCILIPDKGKGLDNSRIQVMTTTNDGFLLAEKDLEQRGPGEFLGIRQSGYAELKLAEITDVRLIEKARNIAKELYEIDPFLQQPGNALLAKTLERFWTVGSGDIS